VKNRRSRLGGEKWAGKKEDEKREGAVMRDVIYFLAAGQRKECMTSRRTERNARSGCVHRRRRRLTTWACWVMSDLGLERGGARKICRERSGWDLENDREERR